MRAILPVAILGTMGRQTESRARRQRCEMSVLMTSLCRRYKHPEFRVTYDSAVVPVEDDARWFVGWLEEAVASGERFAPGQTCQVGWMLTEVRDGGDCTLTLW